MTNQFDTAIQADSLIADTIAYQYEYNPLIRNINFQMGNGDCLHIVGNNGAGKTTLLEIVAGLRTHHSGSIRWNEKPIHSQYYLDSLYIGHQQALSTRLSVAENCSSFIAFAGRSHNIELDQALSYFSLAQEENTLVSQLSAGQRHKLALCRLLLTPAKVWLLDEPFTSLDSYSRVKLDVLLVNHLQAGGMLLITSHQALSETLYAKITMQLDLSS
jgi:heme exporter protein A